MSTEIFVWEVMPSVKDMAAIPFESHASEDKTVYTRALATDEGSAVSGVCIFGRGAPNDVAGNTWQTLFAFYRARGHTDSFLRKSSHAVYRQVTGGALGTGDGSDTTYLFSDGTALHKYIDAASLTVYDGGTATTAYTLSGNNSAPLITFDVAPTNLNVLTVDYEYYRSMLFAGPPQPTIPGGFGAAETLAAIGGKAVSVDMVEAAPGDAYA